MQNVKAFHPLVSSEDIGRGVPFKMTHMESSAAGVGEHVEHVELWFSGIEPWFDRVWSIKGPPFLPKLLPFRFEFRKWKMFSSLAHWYYLVLIRNEVGHPSGAGCLRRLNSLRGGGNFEVVILRCKHF